MKSPPFLHGWPPLNSTRRWDYYPLGDFVFSPGWMRSLWDAPGFLHLLMCRIKPAYLEMWISRWGSNHRCDAVASGRAYETLLLLQLWYYASTITALSGHLRKPDPGFVFVQIISLCFAHKRHTQE